MRIISGEWRGRPIIAPEGRATRPTSDRAREGLFSIIQSRVGSFEGLRVADLFAGSGALGLEALSRGAAYCLFIDNEREAIAAVKQNIEVFDAASRAEVRAQAVEYASTPPGPLDLIFLDPPYGKGFAAMALRRIGNPHWVAPGGLVSIETDGEKIEIPDGFGLETERRFGKAYIHFIRRTS